MAEKVYAETILALANAFVDYCEKASNKNLLDFTNNAGSANFTRFAKELDEAGYFDYGLKNGHAWCAPFVNWLVWEASGEDIQKTKEVMCIPLDEKNEAAGCEGIRKYGRRAGRYDAIAKKASFVIFTTTKGTVDADHTGVVTDIGRDGTIYTIEGNKDNKVTRCVYPPDYWKILGYFHPKYDIPEDQSEKVKELEAANKILCKEIEQLKAALHEVKSLVAAY